MKKLIDLELLKIYDKKLKDYTETELKILVANLIDSAPETLNTLNELATALGNDPNFATSIMTLLEEKVDKENYFGLMAVEPYFDPESDEEDPYTWDKVELTNHFYDSYENTITERGVTVYSAEGANKQLEKKIDKIEGKGLSTNDFTDDYVGLIWGHESSLGDLWTEFNDLESKVFQNPITTIPTSLETNQRYNFGEITELALTFPSIANDGDVVYLTFKSGATATNLTIDTTNTTDLEIIPESNMHYEIFGSYNGSIWLVNYSEYLVSEV